MRDEPTTAQINSACLSYRHDFGLLDEEQRKAVRFEAREWLNAWRKEGFGCDRNEVIERCAAVVDRCNREGPYQAIAAAPRIRALKGEAAAPTAPQEADRKLAHLLRAAIDDRLFEGNQDAEGIIEEWVTAHTEPWPSTPASPSSALSVEDGEEPRQPGYDWKLSEEAKATLAEIDRNIQEAPANIARMASPTSPAPDTTALVEAMAKAWLYGHCAARGFSFSEIDFDGCKGSKLWHDSFEIADRLAALPPDKQQGMERNHD